MDAIIYPCWDYSQTMLGKWATRVVRCWLAIPVPNETMVDKMVVLSNIPEQSWTDWINILTELHPFKCNNLSSNIFVLIFNLMYNGFVLLMKSAWEIAVHISSGKIKMKLILKIELLKSRSTYESAKFRVQTYPITISTWMLQPALD